MFNRETKRLLIVPMSALALFQVSYSPDVSENVVKSEQAEAATNEKDKKIKDRRHPDYIRCRKESVIGSLSKKRKVCMTNKAWALDSRKGNKRAKEVITDNTRYGS